MENNISIGIKDRLTGLSKRRGLCEKYLALFITLLIAINGFSFTANRQIHKNYNNTAEAASELFVYLNVLAEKPDEVQLVSEVARICPLHCKVLTAMIQN